MGWLSLAPLLAVPIVLLPFSFDMGSLKLARRELGMADFLAVRPVSPGQILHAKVLGSACGVAYTWAVVLTLAFFWGILPGISPGI